MLGKASNFLLLSLPDIQPLMLFLLIFHSPGQFNGSVSPGQPVQALHPGAAMARQTAVVSDGEKHKKRGRTGVWAGEEKEAWV